MILAETSRFVKGYSAQNAGVTRIKFRRLFARTLRRYQARFR